MSNTEDASPSRKPKIFAIVGPPNAGKTTLFNALTGLHGKVANYPGATTDESVGKFRSSHGEEITVIDLPGIYSLHPRTSLEERVRSIILGREKVVPPLSGIICVLDASNAYRSLYLLNQVMTLGIPTVCVVTLEETAQRRGVVLEPAGLQKRGLKVISYNSRNRHGLYRLKVLLSHALPSIPWDFKLPPEWYPILQSCASRDNLGKLLISALPESFSTHPSITTELEEKLGDWEEVLIHCYHEKTKELEQSIVQKSKAHPRTRTERADRWLLHPVGGWICLVGILATLLWGILFLSKVPAQWIQNGVEWLIGLCSAHLQPGLLRDILTEGALVGVGNVLVYLPQILILFFFLEILQSTGYLMRAAFLLDRPLKGCGLSGLSFIPLLGSCACTVPGILACRALHNPGERLLTLFIAPWISCSARLPIYMLMLATALPVGYHSPFIKTLLIMALYGIGVIFALVVAWCVKKLRAKDFSAPYIIELPPYHPPSLRQILYTLRNQTRVFLGKAGTVILASTLLLWWAMHYPKTPQNTPPHLEESYIGKVGHAIEPVIRPLGYDWKIGTGLMSAFFARETFVSTLAVLHAPDAHNPSSRHALPELLKKEKKADGTPLYTPRLCMSLMLFFMFSMQCLTTLYLVARETRSLRWPIVQFFLMTGIAYLAAFFLR